jgi:polyisoprenoid-binding protein YceI
VEEAVNPATNDLAIPGYLAGTWQADRDHSTIEFAIRQLTGKARGRFTRYDVTIVTGEVLLDSSVTATIDLVSVDTGNQKRDNHLRGPDYLQAEKYPTMGYRSTGLRHSDDGWVVDGDLTLHGIARPVPLAVEASGFTADQFGRQRAAFSATARISRRDFGITIPMDVGGVVVADKISINLEIQAVRQK